MFPLNRKIWGVGPGRKGGLERWEVSGAKGEREEMDRTSQDWVDDG